MKSRLKIPSKMTVTPEDISRNRDLKFPNPNGPIRLTQCCTQFKSLRVKVLGVMYLPDNVAFIFKCLGNT